MDANQIANELRKLDREGLSLVLRMALQQLSELEATSATEEQSFEDLVPIDAPIESRKDPETGALEIRFPFSIGMRNKLSWRTMEVTPAAQATLLQIFSESLAADLKAGRNPPREGPLQ